MDSPAVRLYFLTDRFRNVFVCRSLWPNEALQQTQTRVTHTAMAFGPVASLVTGSVRSVLVRSAALSG